MATVGYPGNQDDMTGYGAVAGSFRIAIYEVTNAQYTEFLNAVAADDENGLYADAMGTYPQGGILRTGLSPGSSYSVKEGLAAKPVLFVAFWDAVRFCNWMHNGQPTGPQSPSTTESGAYDLTDPDSISINAVTRDPEADYFLPDINEWHKAAYYDARSAALGGPPGDDHFWMYPTRSDTAPVAEAPPGGSNSGNFDAAFGALTTVGAYSGSAGFFGTYDMGGNVYEWTETATDLSRIIRGGSWNDDGPQEQVSSWAPGFAVDSETHWLGFRVAASAD
jgi:formylglycine-generating enzyme required for sulfatase activity